MECKVHQRFDFIPYFDVLIETLWNVKKSTMRLFRQEQIVLIETLWNVKVSHSVEQKSCNLVLIETLWNVKVLASPVNAP